jgi:hypothetical protein
MVGRRVSRARTPPAARIMHNLRLEPVASELQHRKKKAPSIDVHNCVFRLAFLVLTTTCPLGPWRLVLPRRGGLVLASSFLRSSLSSATEGTNVGHSRDEWFPSALRAPHNGQRASMARRGNLAARPYIECTSGVGHLLKERTCGLASIQKPLCTSPAPQRFKAHSSAKHITTRTPQLHSR